MVICSFVDYFTYVHIYINNCFVIWWSFVN